MVFNATFTTIKNMVGLWCLTPLSTQLKKYGWFMVFNATFNTIKNMVGLWCLTPLSTLFLLYHGGQFYL
jgi:hypothetical protein